MADVVKPIATAANVLMVVGISYTVFTAVRFFAFGPEPLTSVESLPQAEQVRDRAIPIERITQMHLFGRPPAGGGAAGGAASAANLAETRLSLVLVGVFVADAAESSIAIVAQRGKPGELYRIGDWLPGNAKLMAVYRDFVVIRRGGAREQLRFETSDEYIQQVAAAIPEPRPPVAVESTPPPEASTASASPGRDSARATLARYRDELQSDPRRLLAEIGLERTTEPDGVGYAVGSLADRPELSQYGLQRGDRIVSVNGRPVGDPGVDQLQLDEVVAQGSASLEIQRGERRFILTYTLE